MFQKLFQQGIKITRYNNKPKINDTNVTVEFEISVRL